MSQKENHSKISMGRVIVKVVVLFVVFNFLFIGFDQTAIGKISLYNSILPGRERLPFGENPTRSYNLTINNIEAMFSSLRLAGEAKEQDEYRVFIVGDSSVWGSLQKNSDTLSGQLNNLNLISCDGKRIVFYNLGYPTLTILKDLMIIDRSLAYHPDLILWLITLESFPRENQTNSELLRNNAPLINQIVKQNGLEESYYFDEPTFIDRTFLNQRRNLADLARLQAFGVMWAATGIDQDLNSPYTRARRDFEQDDTFHGKGQRMIEGELSLEVLEKAIKNMSIPVVLINEPILISHGENSEIRYNYYYPRWAYEQYRAIIKNTSDKINTPFYDFYNLVPEDMFTNSAIHLTRGGEALLVKEITSILKNNYCQAP